VKNSLFQSFRQSFNPAILQSFCLALFLALMTASDSDVQAQNFPGRWQARSMAISSLGIIAAEHPFASQAGAMILARGGHAVDAALAANAVMGVVAPHMNGVGGDLFALVYDAKTGQLHGLNASGWAGSGLTIEFLNAKGFNGVGGVHAVTVPGTTAGWGALREKFGRKPFSEILAAAIRHAEEGFPVAEITARDWSDVEARLRLDAGAASTYLPNGRAPRVGQVFRNPDLAWTYRQIAQHGPDAFYKGEIAKRLLPYLEKQGSTITAADLAEFSAEWVEPVSTTYRGWTVYELPPNGVGIAALEMLNILEKYPLREYGHNSVAALHTMIEAKKLAYADVARHVADPKFAKAPLATLLSKNHADARARLIDANMANCRVPAASMPASAGDTTYLSVVDRDGNMVSLIQSNYSDFGAGLVADGTGFALHNRGTLFSTDRNHPNAVAPRKRPQHTIIPAFMSRDNVRVAFGIMGGWNQSQAHAQFVSNLIDHGMNIQAAMEAARFTKRTFAGCDVAIEGRVPASVLAALRQKGHQIEVHGDFSGSMGGGQAVLRDFDARVNYGASDPRKDGAAIPEPLLP
jgi:gamma-glutamyltranspeptidase/glutathione hydrolase